jgi:hypothetical protein
MPMLDVFTQDAFSVLSLTDAINKIPFVPGRAGQVIDWQERGVTTTSIMIEEVGGVLQMLNPTARGAPGETKAKDKRVARSLAIPHYQHDDAVNADEVQGVRAFGSETEVQSVQNIVNQRLADAVTLVLDPTLEYQRVGALKGIILNADGSTLYNLFTEFGVSQESTIDFNLDGASDTGAVRGVCADAVDLIADNLGGVTFSGVRAFCGKNFFKSLIANIEVRNSYKGTPMAQVLREGYTDPSGNKIYGAFEFGGIVFESYRGKVGNSEIIGADEVRIFPIGVPGLFRTVYAPADYIETVNTVGLPRYSRQYPSANGKRIEMESQMNALSYCTRPKVLLQGTTT